MDIAEMNLDEEEICVDEEMSMAWGWTTKETVSTKLRKARKFESNNFGRCNRT